MADIKQNIDIKVNTDASSLNQLNSAFNSVMSEINKLNSNKITLDGQIFAQMAVKVSNLRDVLQSLSGKIDTSNAVKQLDNITDALKRAESTAKQLGIVDNIDKVGVSLNTATTGSGSGFKGVNIEEKMAQIAEAKKALEKSGGSSELSAGTGNIQELAGALGILPAGMSQVIATASKFGPAIAAAAAAVMVGKKALDMYTGALKEATNYTLEAIRATGRWLASLASGSIDSFVNALKSLPDIFAEIYDSIEKTVVKLKEFSALGEEIGTNYFRIYKYLGATEGSKLIDFAQGLSQAGNVDLAQVTNGLKGILAVTSQLGLKSAEGVQNYTKGLMAMALDVSKFYGYSLEETMTQLETALNMGVLNSRSALARAMDLTDADIEQFRNLDTSLERTNFLMQHGAKIAGTYSQWMKTPAGILGQLDGVLKNLNNTIGQIATRLLAVVAPVLIQIINLANYALQVLAKVLGIDLSTAPGGFSSPDLSNAADEAGRYKDNLGKAKKAQDDLGKSSEKNEKKVASFDDVIQINEDKSSKSGGAADDVGDLNEELTDLGKFDPEKWGSDFANGFKLPELSIDALKAKIKELLDQFKKWAEGIDWSKILDGARKLGETLADILNVIVDDIDAFKLLGSTIGNVINTGLAFLDGFLKKFHFEQFGADIGAMIVSALDALDETLAGDTIADFLLGALNFGIGLFNQMPLTAITDSFTRIFNQIVNDLSSDEGLSTITGFINSFFLDLTTSINTCVDNLEQNDTGGKIATIFYNIFNSLGQNMPAIIAAGTKLINFVFNTLGSTIASSIDGFFDGWFGDDPDEAVNQIIGSIESIITTFFANINKIGTKLQEHLPEIQATITGVIDMISKDAPYWAEQAKPLFDSITQIIKSIDIPKLAAAIMKFCNDSGLFDLIATAGDKMFQIAIAKVVGGLLLFLKSTLGKIVKFILIAANPLFEPILLALSAFGVKIEDIIIGVYETISKIFKWIGDIADGISKKIKEITDGVKNSGIAKGIGDFFGGGSKKNNSSTVGGNNIILNTNIKKAATGGLVTSSTILNVGEAGTEAIIPLERNTAWMDMLASRINAGRSNGGNININVPGKALYTRADLLEIADMVNKAQMAYSN